MPTRNNISKVVRTEVSRAYQHGRLNEFEYWQKLRSTIRKGGDVEQLLKAHREQLEKALLEAAREVRDKPVSAANRTPGPWSVYQLADDVETYGNSAGKWIITADNGNVEVCGVIDRLEDAEWTVKACNGALAADPVREALEEAGKLALGELNEMLLAYRNNNPPRSIDLIVNAKRKLEAALKLAEGKE